jgi:hypothetical protein
VIRLKVSMSLFAMGEYKRGKNFPKLVLMKILKGG